MSKSANLPARKIDDALHSGWNDAASATPAWKQEVNQRLAAHRNRRGATDAPDTKGAESARPASGRAAEAAARVAARYAKAPSYSQLLAGEAREVVRAAGAAAEAALNAQAAAEAVLAGLESSRFKGDWVPAELEKASGQIATPVSAPVAATLPNPAAAHAAPARWQDEPPVENVAAARSWAAPQPRWEETATEAGRDVWAEMRVYPVPEPGYRTPVQEQILSHGNEAGEDETDLFLATTFDSDPMRVATVEPMEHLPANLIEFPRELVAPRKARPRLAEGPLYGGEADDPQLSIFEVDPGPVAPAAPMEGAAKGGIAPPEWASIELDAPRRRASEAEGEVRIAEHAYADAVRIPSVSYAPASEMEEAAGYAMPAELPTRLGADSEVSRNEPAERTTATQAELMVARLSDRVLAAVVDGALVTLAFLAAAVVVIAATAHPPAGRIALIASGCGWLLFGLLYQLLFLSYAEEGTPGMRYARIALCTFDDDNPTREQMRMRIPAMLLSALPAGLGLLWAAFDGDHLGWHDRMTRTYQRKY